MQWQTSTLWDLVNDQILQPPDVFVGIWVGFPFYYLFQSNRMSLQLATVSSPVHEASLDFDGTVDAILRLFGSSCLVNAHQGKKASLRTNHRYPLRIIKLKLMPWTLILESKIHDLRKHSGFDGSIGSWWYFTTLHCQFHLALKILQVIVDHNIHQKIAGFWGLSYHTPTTWQCQKHSKLKIKKVKGSLEHYFCTEKQ